MSYFQFNNKQFEYIDHKSNQTRLNERRIEVPLAFDFMEKHTGKTILEVGNVVSHYNRKYCTTHDVVDLYEKVGWRPIINEDILIFKPKKQYDAVLSISTLEHTENPLLAIKRVLSFAPHVFITVPFGYSDNWIERVPFENGVKDYYMRRINEDNIWEQTTRNKVLGTKYAEPFPFANAILIIEKNNNGI